MCTPEWSTMAHGDQCVGSTRVMASLLTQHINDGCMGVLIMY
jgi:hypothetical protein